MTRIWLFLALYILALVLCLIALVMAYNLASQFPSLGPLTDLMVRL